MPRSHRGARSVWARIAALVLVCTPLLLAPAPLPAARRLTVERLDAELLVQRDGALLVTEQIRVAFSGAWNGIVRSIPVEYPGPGGLNYSLFVKVLEARDEAGHLLRTSLRRRAGSLEVRIFVQGARDATRTVTLRYRVRNALRHFQGYDELWWNVVGNEGETPAAAAGARVYLPPEVTGLRFAAYQGPYGSIERATADTAGPSYVEAENARPLGVNEALTVDVAWDPGVVARPTALARAGLFLASNWALFFPLAALALLLPIWNRRGRDPRRRPIAPCYDPPDGMGAAEAGTLLDNTPDLRDLTAVLVDLAVRGFLTIEEREHTTLGLFTSHEYVFHLARERAAWAELRPHEEKLLDALFESGGRSSVAVNELVNHFYQELPRIKSSIYDELVARGYYRQRPDRVMLPYIVGGIFGGIAIAAGGAAFAERVLGQPALPFIIGGVLTGLVVLLFARIMPARTVRGARALERVLGFQEFLRRVEGDRLQRVVKTPELFERCLPYAMAFGVESNWARAFDDIYREPPSWYRGRGGPFRSSAFTANLGQLCARTAGAMKSAPRGSSSGSGYSGGGGFSGGGFGGGGVGGF